jgi:hypothetical protein
MNQRTAVAPNQAEAEIKSQQRRVSSSLASLRAGKVRCPSLSPLTMLHHHVRPSDTQPQPFGLNPTPFALIFHKGVNKNIFACVHSICIQARERGFAFSVYAQSSDDFTSFATHTKRLLMK